MRLQQQAYLQCEISPKRDIKTMTASACETIWREHAPAERQGDMDVKQSRPLIVKAGV